MNKAIAVFDAGLGSYAIVEAIKKLIHNKILSILLIEKVFPMVLKQLMN